jgi:hypothetical protein
VTNGSCSCLVAFFQSPKSLQQPSSIYLTDGTVRNTSYHTSATIVSRHIHSLLSKVVLPLSNLNDDEYRAETPVGTAVATVARGVL